MDDYYAYQHRRQDRREGRAAPRREPPPEPQALEGDTIDVQEHPASTTIVERIRGALLKRLRGE